MTKCPVIFLSIISLPFASFGANTVEYIKNTMASALKDNASSKKITVAGGEFSDRCQNNGTYYNDYTIDRRCYLTDEQKQQSPYNAVVSLYRDKDGVYCTGTIVKNPNDGKLYVYTAAHCVENNLNKPISIETQNGIKMNLEFAYVGLGKRASDSALYKIPEEYADNLPFIDTGDMYSGYFNVIGYGRMPIMNDKQIQETHNAYLKALKDKKINQDDYTKESIAKFYSSLLPDDTGRLKGSFHCNLSENFPEVVKHSSTKTDCQIWSGNSGGPILDEDGKIVAVVTHGLEDVWSLQDDFYAETYLGGQEEVSEIQDEILNSNSKIRDKKGKCFTAVKNKDDEYIISDSNLCKNIPFGGWNITLGNGATYTGFAKCMPTDNSFNTNDFNNRSITGEYCWCKTAGANANWEYSTNVYKNAAKCENWCEVDCAQDFAKKEQILTSITSKKPNAKLYDKTGECFATVDYHGDYIYTKVDSSQCSGMPFGSWSFIHTNGTKYSGLAKCTPNNSTLNNNEFNKNLDSSLTGKYCWCKLDGANTLWGIGSIFDDEDDCENLCEKRCADGFIKVIK